MPKFDPPVKSATLKFWSSNSACRTTSGQPRSCRFLLSTMKASLHSPHMWSITVL